MGHCTEKYMFHSGLNKKEDVPGLKRAWEREDMIRKIMKTVLAAALCCASWYGFFVLEVEQASWICFILLIQAIVWMAIAFEWGMECVDEEHRISLLITEEDDWDSDTFDEGL